MVYDAVSGVPTSRGDLRTREQPRRRRTYDDYRAASDEAISSITARSGIAQNTTRTRTRTERWKTIGSRRRRRATCMFSCLPSTPAVVSTGPNASFLCSERSPNESKRIQRRSRRTSRRAIASGETVTLVVALESGTVRKVTGVVTKFLRWTRRSHARGNSRGCSDAAGGAAGIDHRGRGGVGAGFRGCVPRLAQAVDSGAGMKQIPRPQLLP